MLENKSKETKRSRITCETLEKHVRIDAQGFIAATNMKLAG